MVINYKEIAFEAAIEHYLTTSAGYIKGDPESFNLERCIDPKILLSFIQETQAR